MNWIQAALVAATGAAQIASIQSASTSGASQAPISGGTAAGGNAGGAGQMPTRIVIEGFDRAALFTGAQLEDLINAINEKAANGTVVISNRVL